MLITKKKLSLYLIICLAIAGNVGLYLTNNKTLGTTQRTFVSENNIPVPPIQVQTQQIPKLKSEPPVVTIIFDSIMEMNPYTEGKPNYNSVYKSIVRVVVYSDYRMDIIYNMPSKFISNFGSVSAGDIFFKGTIHNDYASGNAYNYKSKCDPILYRLSGKFALNMQYFELKGENTIRNKNCELINYSKIILELKKTSGY